jgi:hypothetical protein
VKRLVGGAYQIQQGPVRLARRDDHRVVAAGLAISRRDFPGPVMAWALRRSARGSTSSRTANRR